MELILVYQLETMKFSSQENTVDILDLESLCNGDYFSTQHILRLEKQSVKTL